MHVGISDGGWITKSLICNYEFGVGKAIVKVKKSGSAENQQLADKVQKHWTSILNAKEEEPAASASASKDPSSSVSQNYISLSQSTTSDDSIYRGTRSHKPIVNDDEIEYPKRIKLATDLQSLPSTSPERSKILWALRLRRVDRRTKWNLRRHQSNQRCNIKLSVRLDYQKDEAFIKTPRSDVLSDNGSFTISTNPYFIDYVAFYAGSFSRSLGKFTRIDMPMIESLHESIRGKVIGMRDVLKVLDYLDTGYCGKVVKS